jgi:hypothetical protein
VQPARRCRISNPSTLRIGSTEERTAVADGGSKASSHPFVPKAAHRAGIMIRFVVVGVIIGARGRSRQRRDARVDAALMNAS